MPQIHIGLLVLQGFKRNVFYFVIYIWRIVNTKTTLELSNSVNMDAIANVFGSTLYFEIGTARYPCNTCVLLYPHVQLKYSSLTILLRLYQPNITQNILLQFYMAVPRQLSVTIHVKIATNPARFIFHCNYPNK
jgi:hypothetical protein